MKTLGHNIRVPMTMTSASPKNVRPTIFDLSDVPHQYIRHWQLDDLAATNHLEFLLLLDAALQPTKLLLLRPVVEGRHQHHAHHRQQDGCALDPASVRLTLIFYSTCRHAACCSHKNKDTEVSLISKGLDCTQTITVWCGFWLCFFLFHQVDVCHVSFDATPWCLSIAQWQINFAFVITEQLSVALLFEAPSISSKFLFQSAPFQPHQSQSPASSTISIWPSWGI